MNGTSSALRVERKDDVLWLTKTNPDMGYGICMRMLAALREAIAAAAADPTIRAMVIDAEGEELQNGAVMVTEIKPDLADLTREDFAEIVDIGVKLGRSLASLPIPVIALARGGALGGGLELMLRSDFVFCIDTAAFSFPEVTLGLVAAWGGTQWAGRMMPFRKAQEFLLLGEEINGRRAEEFGLVTRSFGDGAALDAHVVGLLDRLRHCSPRSFKWTKACLAATWDGPLSHGEAVEADAEIETMASGDFLKAVGAYYGGVYYDFVADGAGGAR